jgi:L-ascorbate metabolism protein UlaG (beta-lactamase superfamily)
MNIIWRGQSCFQISSSQGKNGNVNIVIDPFSEGIGLKLPKMEADILLVTHQHYDHNNIKAIAGDPFVIQDPGEYDIKDFFIQGFYSFHDNVSGKERGSNTIYTISGGPEDINICHLGDFGQKELTAEQIEKIGEVDILMIPVGGVFTVSAKEAAGIIAQIEPKITIPMHYHLPKLNLPSKEKLGQVEDFLKELGIKKPEPLAKLSIKKKDISPEEAKIIVLQP